MKRTTTALIVIVIIALIAVGVVAVVRKPTHTPPPSSSSSSQTLPKTATINIRDMMFTPSQISIQQGGTVTWTNNDTTTHTVVDDLNDPSGPHSGNIAPGSTYSFTFNKDGSFKYHCSIHPSMRGTIVVK